MSIEQMESVVGAEKIPGCGRSGWCLVIGSRLPFRRASTAFLATMLAESLAGE